MKNILITGFDPFHGETINPSFEIIKFLDTSAFHANIHIAEIPTVFYDASKKVIDLIHTIKPDIVIMLGQAGGRKEISLERVAINIDDANIPDNLGRMPSNQPISVFGPNAYFASLPLAQLESVLKSKHIPVAISNTAGTYVCNHLMYSVLHEAHVNNLNLIAGFIHVPYLPEQTLTKPSKFSLDQSLMVQALEIIIETLIDL